MKLTVDTRSTINIIDETTFKELENINLQNYTYEHIRSIQVNSFRKIRHTYEETLTVATIYVAARDGGYPSSIIQAIRPFFLRGSKGELRGS